MDKAIIVGTYEFIGFHLCQSLLEQGVEVIGIHIPTNEDIFLEEKQLSIARNGNFTEKEESYLYSLEPNQKNTVCFIDYFSYFMMHKEEQLETLLKWWNELENPLPTVLVLPIHFCLIEKETNSENFLCSLMNLIHQSQCFYMPTVYGPWQPPHLLFQKALMGPKKTFTLNDREWTKDALFIHDAIGMILDNIQEKELGNTNYVLSSTIADHWNKAWELVNKTEKKPPFEESLGLPQMKEGVVPLQVKSTNLEDALDRQRKHWVKFQQTRI